MELNRQRSAYWIILTIAAALFLLLLTLAAHASVASARVGAEQAQIPAAPTATSVFINEIHYDNAGTDTGEGIEIAGPATTDLSGWTLELYNGNGGSSYGQVNLSGTITNQQDGYGTIFFAVSGLQNGPPDGIALVDPSNNVVQFLSYEGTFTAVGGSANGLTSTDIGVEETSSTPVGDSLQLTGSGNQYDDFTWSGPIANTYDDVNTGQTFVAIPDLTIAKTGSRYIRPGDPIVYTITVNNTNIPTAGEVVVTDTLPVGTTFSAESSSYTYTNPEDGVYVWQIGDLAPWTSATIALTVTTDSSAPTGTDFINSAEISTSSNEDDPSNNTAQWTTTAYRQVTIHEVQYATDPETSDASPLKDETVWTEGIVTAEPGEIDTPTRTFIIEEPGGGPWSGLTVFKSSGFPGLDAPAGTLVRVLGTVTEYNGLTEFSLTSGPTAVQVLSTGNPVPAPEVIPSGDFSTASTAEQWEGVLIEFRDAAVSNSDLGYGEWAFDDGSGSTRADDLGNGDGNMTYTPVDGDVYQFISGIGYYSFGDYKLEPRFNADIKLQVTEPEISKDAPVLVAPGDPFTYTINVKNRFDYDLTGVVITDTVPANTTFDHALDGGTLTDGVVSWDVGTLASQASISVQFVVTAADTPAYAINDQYAISATNFVTPTFGAPVQTVINTRLHIHDIQGPGELSPFDGQDVSDIQGIVTELHYDSTSLTAIDGFFMQDPEPDANAATSEGIFVYTGSQQPDFSVGEGVTVTGTVNEYYDFTEIDSSSILTFTTATQIDPTSVSLPVPEGTNLEPYESMLVTIPGSMTVAQNYFQGRYGQVTLSADGRMYNPTNGNDLGDTFEYDQRRMLILDDDNNAENPDPIPYIGVDNTLRAGDTVSNLTGVIDYGRIDSSYPPGTFYRLQPTVAPVFTRVNQRTAAPDPVGGNVKVASFNVLNYFNGDGQGGGFPTSRGADTIEEFDRQRTKIITAVVSLDADVVGLMEIENDGDDASSAIQDLVNGLNEATAPGTYAFVPEPEPGTDEIKVAMIYKPGVVTPVGDSLNYQVYDDPVYTPLFDRPPLAQTFKLNSNNAVFTVVVNHFKSKGSCPASGPDAEQGDGQGCWNAKRVAQASGLLDFVSALQASSGDPDVVVIGDLNAYGIEDPINTLTAGGLVNEIASNVEAHDRYTYVFDGLAGYLDQGLVTSSVDPQVSGVTLWHINSDEPSVIDYNTEYKPQDFYTPTPYRASDHDPVLLGLNLTVPELEITKTVTPGVGVTPGGVVTYTIELTNNGDGIATHIMLTDTLPTEVTFGNWVTQNDAAEANGVVTWNGDLAAGASLTWVFTATVSDDPALYNQTIANTVEYTSENEGAGTDSVAFMMAKRILLPIIYNTHTP